MIVYEVRKVGVETNTGRGALVKFINQSNQDTELLQSFKTIEEAKEFYKTVDTSVRYMGGYYYHECKMIEENVYDEAGEWIGGGDWIKADFPDKEAAQ